MKIDNEIETLTNRITLLENQNIRFKNLLDSALEVTKQSVSRTQIQKDETEFLQETIKLIEDEKVQLQKDLYLITSTENDNILFMVRQIGNENLELRKKVEVLLNQAQKHAKEIEQLKMQHSEYKFLLTQPDANTQLLKNILSLDNSLANNSSISLMGERCKLQQKIVALERKKTELLTAIEDIRKPAVSTKITGSEPVKSDLDKVLFKVFDDTAKRECENLNVKVLDLEQQRSKLLSELQLVLDSSRKEIANEYHKLQRKILDIETEKAGLRLTLETLSLGDTENKTVSKTQSCPFKDKIDNHGEIDKILNAFTNLQTQINLNESQRRKNGGNQLKRTYYSLGLPTCSIL